MPRGRDPLLPAPGQRYGPGSAPPADMPLPCAILRMKPARHAPMHTRPPAYDSGWQVSLPATDLSLLGDTKVYQYPGTNKAQPMSLKTQLSMQSLTSLQSLDACFCPYLSCLEALVARPTESVPSQVPQTPSVLSESVPR